MKSTREEIWHIQRAMMAWAQEQGIPPHDFAYVCALIAGQYCGAMSKSREDIKAGLDILYDGMKVHANTAHTEYAKIKREKR